MSRSISLVDPVVKSMPTHLNPRACAHLYELFIEARAADKVQAAAQREAQSICDKYNEANKLYREVNDIPEDATINLVTGEIALKDDKSGLPA